MKLGMQHSWWERLYFKRANSSSYNHRHMLVVLNTGIQTFIHLFLLL